MALTLKRKRGNANDGVSHPKRRLVDNDNEVMDPEDVDEDGDSDSDGYEGESKNVDELHGIAQPIIPDPLHTGTKPSKPPTGEELRTIKDASSLFRSNSFKLQIDALLPNIHPKSHYSPPLSTFLHTLHSFLIALPPSAPQHPLAASRSFLKKGIAVPYAAPLPTEDTNWKVAFEKPTQVLLVGSWANKCSVKGKDGRGWGVDLTVEMPESLFQEKDYLNGRFFHKRAFFLATIASAIISPKSSLNVNVFWDSNGDDPRLTTLVLTPRKDDSPTDFSKSSAYIRIIPVLPTPSPFPLHRLSPSHCNIRTSTSNPSSSIPQLPTPLYNTCILLSFTPKPHLLSIHNLTAISAYNDALALLRVWANQRGYTHGGIHGFSGIGSFWAAVLGVVINGEEGGKRKPLGKGLSSYQLFRAALDFFVKVDWENEAVFLKSNDGHQFQPEEYRAHHSAVFVDFTSLVNLLAGVPLSSLDMLKYDARKTLEVLDQTDLSGDPFSQTFLKDQTSLITRFDAIIRVDLSSARPRSLPFHSTLDFGSPTSALLSSLSSVLRQALGNRTHAIAILPSSPPPSTRPISLAHPSPPTTITLGLIYNTAHAFRLVDHGPQANDPDPLPAKEFRDFWGPKAELRRFKDGRIGESVVWDEGVKTADDKMGVPVRVVRYILERHFGVGGQEEDVKSWQGSFDSMVRIPEMVASVVQSSRASTGFKAAITAFDDLVKGIRALFDELPLSLSTISPVSEYLRYTSVFSPIPFPSSPSSSSVLLLPTSARYIPPMEIIFQFEKSSRWPDDLRAIQKIKLAFFERIASALMSAIPNLKATVVVGDGSTRSEIADQARLEIVTEQGWAFSARIWHDREATLLDKIINDKTRPAHIKQKPPTTESSSPSSSMAKDRQEALEAREIYTRRFIHAPRHHRAIASLCHRFSAYAGTVRLVKRWLASHWLLQGHVSEEIVEIICARLFVGDGKSLTTDVPNALDQRANVPGSKQRGFAAVIEFLKDWRYEEELFVPLYGSTKTNALSSDTTSDDVKMSAGSRKMGGVWTVRTEADKEGYAWTSQNPELIAALRVRTLAKATWEHLQGLEQGDLDVKALFIHPTDDYDFVVHLDPALLPRYYQNVNSNLSMLSTKRLYANLPLSDPNPTTRPGFDPAWLLFDDLRRIYADTLKLFYDPFGGDRIGAVLDPTLRNARLFRVLGGFSSIPMKKENEKKKDKGVVGVNEAAILTEIERLGSGIVTRIVASEA